MPRIYIRKDHVGHKFGRLLVRANLPDIRNGDVNIRIVDVVCDCGTEYTARLHALISGSIKSCGCLHKEKARQTCIDRNTTHSDSGSKEHNAWKAMNTRCYNEGGDTYKYYGERGIGVADVWRNNYSAFLKDMGRAPDSTHIWSVGRQDNNQDYSPSNCMWEIWNDQAQNRGMQENNTSGFTGVYKKYRRGILHFTADWSDFGKRCTKIFSTNKYGVDGALKLAVEHRALMIETLNQQGAAYTPEHGLPRKVKEQ